MSQLTVSDRELLLEPPGSRAQALPASTSLSDAIPWAERVMAGLLVLAGLVVRGLALLRHEVNSDEPQHLHVAWGWTQGLLPYRDVFDNHSPLFSLLMSLPLRWVGEQPGAVVLMRLWMLPFALASLWLTAIIARRVFGARTALWSVALLGVETDFLLGSVEYRTDVMWACAWLGVLAVMVGGRMSRRRAFAAGVLAGVALAISMKTSLLVTTMGLGVGVTWLASRRDERPALPRVARLAAVAAAGFILVPLAVVSGFALAGALKPMLQCTVGYNVLPGLGLWGTAPLRPLGLLAGVPLLVALTTWMARRNVGASEAHRGALLLASAGLAHLAIETLWPLVVRGDMLAIRPVEVIFLAAVLAALASHARGSLPGARAILPGSILGIVVLGGLVLTWNFGDLGHDGTRHERRALSEILHLTRPDEPVMDVKGESVFRPRPIYTAIETIAEERYRRGELVDDIPERLIATGTAVVMQYDAAPYPRRAWAFMQANYLPAGYVRVLGQHLDPPASGADERTFVVAVPQVYALFGREGPARGSLDGETWRGPTHLGAGAHRYVAAPGEGRLALVWAPAVERGFAPALLPAPPPSLNAADRVLVLAAHPDDETVSNGGLILAAYAAGARVNVLWATDGGRNPWAQLAHEGRWPVTAADRARWAALRRGESRAALRVLGAADAGETWLGLRDGGLTRQWMSGDGRLADSILSAIRRFRPTIVSAPSLFDSHPDHSLLGLAAETALARLEGSAPQPRLIEYCTHNTDLAPGATLRLRLPPDAQASKLRAIECIPSQLHWRRRELTAYADSVECFDPPDVEVAGMQTHRVRSAWIDGDRIVVDFVGGRWPSLGPLTLRVSCEGAASPLRRFTIVLPARAGDIPVQDGSYRAHSATARLSRLRDGWRIEVPLGLDSSPLNSYVKIERPLELACGFFDESGWWPVERVRGRAPVIEVRRSP